MYNFNHNYKSEAKCYWAAKRLLPNNAFLLPILLFDKICTKDSVGMLKPIVRNCTLCAMVHIESQVYAKQIADGQIYGKQKSEWHRGKKYLLLLLDDKIVMSKKIKLSSVMPPNIQNKAEKQHLSSRRMQAKCRLNFPIPWANLLTHLPPAVTHTRAYAQFAESRSVQTSH
jgi:hypothetical protein